MSTTVSAAPVHPVVTRPILFSGPMVRAILKGGKTQTRRVIVPQPPDWCREAGVSAMTPPRQWEFRGAYEGRGGCSKFLPCPYLPACETLLWVRETWARLANGSDGNTAYRADGRWGAWSADGVFYPHGWIANIGDNAQLGKWVGRSWFGPWRPSIHMPRWASRITLRVRAVRAERLQQITEADAEKEGVDYVAVGEVPRQAAWTHRQDFAALWDKINGQRGYGWDVNPWVWVVTFERVVSHPTAR